MKFGLKVHHRDLPALIDLGPETLEFVLFPEDLDGTWYRDVHFHGPIVLHMPEKFADGSLVDPGSPDPGERKAAVVMLKKTVDLANEMGASNIICHPGGVRREPVYIDPAYLFTSMRELQAYLPGGVGLLLENMPDIYWYKGGLHASCLFKQKGEIIDMLATLDLGLCLDVCHAKLLCAATGEDFSAYIMALMPFTEHIHISDARGTADEGVQIGEGEIDFRALSRDLGGLDVAAVPEILDGHKAGGSGFRTAYDRLAKLGFYDTGSGQ